jgi:DNA-binding NtrC family response regulator
MYRFAIIEDDKPTNNEFKGYLEKIWADCMIVQYFTFETGLRGIQGTEFDLVVSDIDLGAGTDKFGGMKIAKALDSAKTPLLVISGSSQPDNREIFRALDAWDYLQKPVTESDFINQVKRAVAFRMVHLNSAEQLPLSPVGMSDPDLTIDLHSKMRVAWKGKRG